MKRQLENDLVFLKTLEDFVLSELRKRGDGFLQEAAECLVMDLLEDSSRCMSRYWPDTASDELSKAIEEKFDKELARREGIRAKTI